MFPMTALLTHAELSKRKTPNRQSSDARRAVRCTRHGNLTLFPRVERAVPVNKAFEEMETPRVIASISNVSTSGVGLIVNEELPDGLEFDVQWPQPRFAIPLRFEVVHSQAVSGGMYRTGARLVAGVLPAEPMPSNFVNGEQPDETQITANVADFVEITTPLEPAAVAESPIPESPVPESPVPESPVVESPVSESRPATEIKAESEIDIQASAAAAFANGVLKFEPDLAAPSTDRMNPSPAGTLRISSAFGFDKTQTIEGVTTCGWERSISLRRDGERLWVYIHSPGKKNGWGIYVNPDQFESALENVRQSASSPFISTLAA
jgi:hypothetical protein